MASVPAELNELSLNAYLGHAGVGPRADGQAWIWPHLATRSDLSAPSQAAAGATKRGMATGVDGFFLGLRSWRASSGALAAEFGPQPGSEPHGGIDLDSAYRDTLDVQPEGNADAPAKAISSIAVATA
jgi:hypothetical protein